MPPIECPLCGGDCYSLDHARQHMHTDHLKSEIIDAYIEATELTSRETDLAVPRQ